MYGPRLKILARESDGPKRVLQEQSFKLLFDDLDESKNTSKIVIFEVPRGQLEEWYAAFAKALGN